jgi:hypothetical protein
LFELGLDQFSDADFVLLAEEDQLDLAEVFLECDVDDLGE